MELQRIGDEDAEADDIVKDTAFKADIQAQLNKAAKPSKTGASICGGFILWLDFTRKTVDSNDFLLERPSLLPSLEKFEAAAAVLIDDDDDEDDGEAVVTSGGDENGDRKSKKKGSINPRAPSAQKLFANAKDIAAVSRTMLKDVKRQVLNVSIGKIPGIYVQHRFIFIRFCEMM